MRRRLLGLTVVLSLTMGAMPIALASPAAEADFVSLSNSARANAGLAPLTVDNALVAYARTHTGSMIASGSIFHSTSAQLSSIATGWSRMGENVGMGPNAAVIQQAFMNSPGHKANILGDFNYVGIGVDTAPNGTMFVTVIFMKKAGATPTTTTTAPAPATTQPPVAAAPPVTTTTQPAPKPPTTTTTPPTQAAQPGPIATNPALSTPSPASRRATPPAICHTSSPETICLD